MHSIVSRPLTPRMVTWRAGFSAFSGSDARRCCAAKIAAVHIGAGRLSAIVFLALLAQSCEGRQSAWERARAIGTIAAYEDFEQRFPGTPEAHHAGLLICAKQILDAETVNTAEAYRTALAGPHLAALLNPSPAADTAVRQIAAAHSSLVLPPRLLSVTAFLRGSVDETNRWRAAADGLDPDRQRSRGWFLAAASGPGLDSRLARFALACVAPSTDSAAMLAEALPGLRARLAATVDRAVKHSSTCRAVLAGSIDLMSGDYGCSMYSEKDTKVTGSVDTALGGIAMRAEITGFAQLEHRDTRDVVGWGIVATRGDIVLDAETYGRVKSDRTPIVAGQRFDASPIDYSGRFLLVQLAAESGHRFVIPVQINVTKDGLRESLSCVPGELRGSLEPSGIAAGFSLNTPTGMSLFGGEMRLALDDRSVIDGPLQAVPRKE